MKKRQLTLAIGLVISGPAFAHVCNIDLTDGTPSLCGDSPYYITYVPAVESDGMVIINASQINPYPAGYIGDPACPIGQDGCNYIQAGINQFQGDGWIMGTLPHLGDSHNLHGGNFFTFTVKHKSKVTIKFQYDANYVDYSGAQTPADVGFSLYGHKLPIEGHDDGAAFDLTGPAEQNCGYPIASPADKHPKDPGIAQFLTDITVDSTGTPNCSATPNPDYTPSVAELYNRLYPKNGRYRDTLNFVALNGLDPNSPGYPLLDDTYRAFYGQFNALNSWSMASAADDINNHILKTYPDGYRYATDPVTGEMTWGEIKFIKAVNQQIGTQAETLVITLEPGEYTIAAAGADQPNVFFGGELSVKIVRENLAALWQSLSSGRNKAKSR